MTASQPHPASRESDPVPEAMREAVLALLHVKLKARITGPAWEQVRFEWLGFEEVAHALCAPSGPIAKELDALRAELSAAHGNADDNYHRALAAEAALSAHRAAQRS